MCNEPDKVTHDLMYRLEQTFCLVQLKGSIPLNALESKAF